MCLKYVDILLRAQLWFFWLLRCGVQLYVALVCKKAHREVFHCVGAQVTVTIQSEIVPITFENKPVCRDMYLFSVPALWEGTEEWVGTPLVWY